VGPSEALLLQMKPNFVTHVELVWHPMLIMTLFVLWIFAIQYVMDLLEDVLNALNEAIIPITIGSDINFSK